MRRGRAQQTSLRRAAPRSSTARNRARGDRFTADTARRDVGRVRHAGTRAFPAPFAAEPVFVAGLCPVRMRHCGAVRRAALGAHASPRAATDRRRRSARSKRRSAPKFNDAEPRTRRPTHGRHGATRRRSSAARGLACAPGALRRGAGSRRRSLSGADAASRRRPSGRAGNARVPACRNEPTRKIRAQQTAQRRAAPHRSAMFGGAEPRTRRPTHGRHGATRRRSSAARGLACVPGALRRGAGSRRRSLSGRGRHCGAVRRAAPGTHASSRAATDRRGRSARSKRRRAAPHRSAMFGDAEPRTRRPIHGRHGATRRRSSAARGLACAPGSLRRGAGSRRRSLSGADEALRRRPSGRAGSAREPACRNGPTQKIRAQQTAQRRAAPRRAAPRSSTTRNRARGDRSTADTARRDVGRVRHAGSRAFPAPFDAEPALVAGLYPARMRHCGAVRRAAPGTHASPRAATDRRGRSARSRRRCAAPRRDVRRRGTAHAATDSRPTRRDATSVECGTRARVRSRRPPTRSRFSSPVFVRCG
jgi:hypothetical protein